MNTAHHKKKTVTKHEVIMTPVANDGRGSLNRREVSDLLFQADSAYEQVMGHRPASDDAYYITGNEEGMKAFWVTDKD